MRIRTRLFAAAVLPSALALAACASSPPPPSRTEAARPQPASPAAPPGPSASASTGATPPAPPSDPKAAHEASVRCIADPACSRQDAARLVVAAADAGATDDCMDFYYGVAVTKDWARARACYERAVREEPACGDQSPTLERLMLATMMLDGQGGPKVPGARVQKLFDGCFADASVTSLLDTAAKGKTPIDFCTDVGGTTLSMSACGDEAVARLETERLLLRKDLAKKVSPDVLDREELAHRAFDGYVEAAAALAADDARGGTMAGLLARGEQEALLEARNDVLRAIAAGAPDGGAAAPGDAAYDAALKKARAAATDADARRLVDAADAAYRAWRPAEVAFERACAAPADAPKAEAAATARATRIAIASLGRRLHPER